MGLRLPLILVLICIIASEISLDVECSRRRRRAPRRRPKPRPVRCRVGTRVLRKCRRGRQLVRHFYKRRTRRGRIVCAARNQWRRCRGGRRGSARTRGGVCRCSAVGDPHYRTYDGQVIHFMGVCKYTLTKLKNKSDKCYFNVEVQAEHRGRNRRVSFVRFLDVTVGGQTVRLGQRRRLAVKVNGKWQNTRVPYKKNGVRVFYSGRLLQLVYSKCKITVAFNGRSNSFVSVPGRFGGKMTGICGDCNRKRDDFRTAAGKDVSRNRNKYNLIGDSYRVGGSLPRRGGKCKKDTPAPPKTYCKGKWSNLINRKKYCGTITDASGPFGKCVRSGKVNTYQLLLDCRIDMCSNTHNPRRMKVSRCEILKALSEQCAEKGITNIDWRTKAGCKPHCGTNKVFRSRVQRCPETCTSHFYGHKRLCHLLPKREGCECKKGYILDGSLCVKPKQCKCLESCVNRLGAKKCAVWKRQGRCTKFAKFMNTYCKRACNKCKRVKPCVDRASTKRCQIFRRQGRCKSRFYKELCGLTCNYKKCPCGKNRTKKTKCHPKKKVQTVFRIIYFRNSRTGRCGVRRTRRVIKCGRCPRYARKIVGRCNVCKGRKLVTRILQRRVRKVCTRSVRRFTRKCLKCVKKIRRRKFCRRNTWIFTTHVTYRKGCYKCLAKSALARRRVKCSRPRNRIGKCSRKRGCMRRITIFRVYVRNCVCRKRRFYRLRRCCCRRPWTKPLCHNGSLCRVSTRYVLRRNRCNAIRKRRCKKITCPKTKVRRGKCRRNSNCYAVDRQFRYVRLPSCRCKLYRTAKSRKCCCKKMRKIPSCNRRLGWIIVRVVIYRLNRRRNRCDRRVVVEKRQVKCRRNRRVNVARCNRRSCKTWVTVSRTVRRGCKCKRVQRRYRRNCCCRGNITRKQCRGITKVFITRKRVLTRRYRCVWKTTKVRRMTVKCRKRPIVIPANCRRRRFYKVYITFFARRCKCFQRRRRVRVPCRCPLDTGKLFKGKCNKKCLKVNIYKKGYRAGNGKCRIRSRRVVQRCCCTLKPRRFARCNRRNGHILVTRWRYVFNRASRRCIRIVKRSWRIVRCKGRSVTRGKCGSFKKWFYLRTIYRNVHYRHACRCRRIKSVKPIRCKCPKSRLLKKVCYRRAGVVIVRKRHYRLIRNLYCRSYTTVFSKRRVRCSRRVRTKRTKCTGRNRFYYIHKRYLRRAGCKCVLRKRSWRRLCKCAGRNSWVRCIRNVSVRFIRYYRRNRNHTRCVPFVRRVPRRISCRRTPKVTRTKCNRCNFARVYYYFGVVNCKCIVRRRRITRHKCCCRKKQRRVLCLRNILKRRTISWSLRGGRCYRRVSYKIIPRRCKKAKRVAGPCSRRTRRRLVRFVYWVKVNCICRRRQRVFSNDLCSCPRRRRVLRRRCGRSNRRQVLVQWLSLIKKRCQWRTRRRFFEACRCRRTTGKTRCIKNRKYFIRVRHVLTSSVVRGVRVYRCKRVTNRWRRRVYCRRVWQRWTRCSNYKRRLIRHYFIKRNCRCVKRTRPVLCRACACRRLNTRRQKCVRGRFVTITSRYGPAGCRCKRVTTKRSRAACRRRIWYRYGKCIYKRGNRIERWQHRYVIVANKKCKCVTRRSSRRKLCSCKKSWRQRRCIRHRIIRYTTYRVIRRGNKCLVRPKTHVRIVRCRSTRRVIRRRLNRKTCRYILTVRWYSAKNCVCRPKYSTLQQVACCKRKPTSVRKCIKNRKVLIVTRWVRVALRTRRRRSPRIVIYRCTKRIYKRTIPQRCGVTRIRRSCNKRTGVYLIVILRRIKRNCKCIVKRSVIRKRCRCQKGRNQWGKCRKGYRKWTYKYAVLVRHRCIKRQRSRRCACSCPRNVVKRRCLKRSGRRFILTIRYILNRSRCPRRCRRIIKRRYIPLRCSVRVLRSTSRCNRKTCKQNIRIVIHGYDRKNCKCKRSIKYVKRTCCCPNKRISAKRCVSHRNLVWTITYYRLIRYRCHRYRINKRKRVYCGRRTKRVSNCKKNGYRYIKYFFRVARNCKCKVITEQRKRICSCGRINKYRTRKSVSCSRNGRSWRRVTIYYILRNNRCLRRTRVRYRHVRCHGVRRRALCNKKSCVKTILTYVKRARKCKCKYVLHSRNNRLRCCCPKPRYVRTVCVANRIKRFWYRRYVLARGYCRRQNYRKDRVVRCSRRRIVQKICPKKRGRCNGLLLYKRFRSIKCKCRLVLFRRRSIKCCCRKMIIRKHCWRNSTKVTRVWRYTLKNFRCNVKYIQSRRRVNCRRRGCKIGYTKCSRNFQYRVTRCFRARNCVCRPFNIRKRRRCSCLKRSRTRRGGCNRRTCFRKNFIQIYSFNKRNRKCYWRLARRWNVRCCCKRKVTKRHACIGNVVIRTWYTIRVFDRRRKVCRNIVEKRNRRIRGCSRRPRLVRQRRSACNKVTGYRTIRKRYVVAKRCKCRHFVRKSRVPCLCRKIYPSKKWRVCRRNVWITTTVRYVLRGNRCFKLVRQARLRTRCPRGIKLRKYKCKRSAWTTKLVYLRLVPRNCRCRWTRFRIRRIPCRCRGKKTHKQCFRNVWRIRRRYVSYIKSYRCYYRIVLTRRRTACKVGTIVKKSKCGRKNRYVITRITKYIHGCRCRRRIRRRHCHCKCGKPTFSRRCVNYRIYRRKSYFVRIGCRCIRRVRNWSIYPRCPRIRRLTVTKCVRKGVTGRRWVIRRWHIRNRRSCTCTVKVRKQSQICWCKREVKKTKRCIKNRWFISHYRRQRGRKACVFKRYYRRVLGIRCRRNRRLRSACNRKTRLRTITNIRYRLTKCKCVRSIKRTFVTCACRNGRKYVYRGKCNRKTCFRKSKYYTLVLRGTTCVKRYRKYVRRCCCRKLKAIRRCQNRYNRFIHIKRWFVLIRGRCLYRQRVRYTYVRCNRKLRVNRRCLKNKNCTLIITISRHTKRNCKCQWRIIRRRLRKCCCPKGRKIVACQASRKRKWIRLISYRLRNGRCLRLSRSRYTRINCPKRTTRVICNKKSGIRTVVRTWHSVSRNCVCRKHINRRRSRCGCKRNKKMVKRCHKRSGIRYTFVYLTLLRRFRCIRKRFTEKRRTVCSRKRWISRGKCRKGKYIGKRVIYHNYFRRSGCKCIKAHRSRVCNCNCRKPKNTYRCIRNNLKVFVKYRIVRWGCRCRIVRRFVRRGVRCARSRVVRSKCNKKTRRITFHYISFAKRNCKCKKVVRSVVRVCRCRKPSRTITCNRNSNTRVFIRRWYVFRPWRCYLRRRVVRLRTNCRRNRIIRFKCNKRTRLRKYIRIVAVKRNCKCLYTRRPFFRVCSCKPGFNKVGKCDRRRCVQLQRFYGRRLVGFKCKTYIRRQRLLRCCCKGRPFKFTRCIRNKYYVTTGYYKFVRRGRLCRKISTVRTVVVRCSRKPRLVLKRCLRNGVLLRKFVRRYLARCKCHRRFYYRNVRCKCNRPRHYRVCRRHRFKFYRKIYWVLVRGRCVRKIFRKTRRVNCRRPIRRVTRCKRIGCRQAVIRILFRSINCVCRSRKIVRWRTCCCTRRVVRWSRCSNKTGVRYYYKRYYVFDSKRFLCRVKTDVTKKPSKCSRKNIVKYGRCKWPRGVYRVQFVYTRIFYRVACRCTSRVRRSYRLCDCGKSRKRTVCNRRAGLRITYQYGANLKIVRGFRRCIRYRRVLNKRKIVCLRVSPRVTKCNRRNCLRYKVLTTYYRRGCKCVRRQRRIRYRCCCKQRKNRSTCVRNRRVTVYFKTRLLCRGLRCVCRRRTLTTVRPVRCANPKVKLVRRCNKGKGRRVVQYTYYILRRCKCIKRSRRRAFSCKRRCIDYSRSCRALERQGFCETSSQVRNRLCKKSCGTCGCPKKMSYCKKSNKSMKTGKIYGGVFEITRPKVPRNYVRAKRVCQKLCTKNKRCRAYQIRVNLKKRRVVCVLNKVTPPQLRRRTNGRHRAVRTPKSAIWVKYCHRRCRKAKILRVTKCRCTRFLRGNKVCSRKALIAVWRHKVCRGCVRRVIRRSISCKRSCKDRRPKACRRLKAQRKCGNKVVKRLCKKSCGGCGCRVGTFRYRGPCNQRTKKYRVARIRFYKSQGICYRSAKFWFVKCPVHEVCKPRTIVSPKPCVRGRRVTVYYIVKKVGTQCKRIYRKRVTKCAGCCPSVTVIPGPCRNNRRLVTRIWWDNIRGCCRRRVSRSLHLCRGCPSRVGKSYGACRLRWRVRYVTYYIRSNRRCSKRVVAKLVRC